MTEARRAAAVLALLALPLLAGCGPADTAAPPPATYGSLPSFLPSASIRPDGVLTGTAARPALTSEGDTVLVRTAAGSVRATVTGPVVPGEGLPYQADATTCTWTLTLTGAGTPVPVALADFSTLDHLGTAYRVTLAPGSAAPPARLNPGRTATFAVRTVMAVGEGVFRWAPSGGPVLASWDFVVEND